MNLPQAFKTRRVKETLVALYQHVETAIVLTRKQAKPRKIVLGAKLRKIMLDLTEALIDAKRPRGKKTSR